MAQKNNQIRSQQPSSRASQQAVLRLLELVAARVVRRLAHRSNADSASASRSNVLHTPKSVG